MTFVVDIVTGASQGIGRAIAEYVAIQRSIQHTKAGITTPQESYSLVMVGRNVARGSEAADAIRRAAGGSFPAVFEACDLSNYDDVVRLKGRISSMAHGANEVDGGTKAAKEDEDFRVGILVNDAAECPSRQELVLRKQMQGAEEKIVELDKQFATNVLGYHFMLNVFRDNFAPQVNIEGNLNNIRPTHIINIASNWAGNLDLSDLQFQRRGYDNDTAYRQSKQCNRMLTKAWSEKLKGSAIVNSCHPGDPCTTLSKALGYNLWSSQPSRRMIERDTPIPFLCGFSQDDVTISGGWFQGPSEKPMRCQFAGMIKDTEKIFEVCEGFCC